MTSPKLMLRDFQPLNPVTKAWKVNLATSVIFWL